MTAMVGVVGTWWLVVASAAGQAPALDNAPRDYSIEMIAPSAVTVGAEASLRLVITPRADWQLKTDTPFATRVVAPEGVALARSEWNSRDFVDPKSAAKTLNMPFVSKGAGEHEVRAEVEFYLCNAAMCKPLKDSVAKKITIR